MTKTNEIEKIGNLIKVNNFDNTKCPECGKPYIFEERQIGPKTVQIPISDCQCDEIREAKEAKIIENHKKDEFKNLCEKLFPVNFIYDELGIEQTFDNFEINKENKTAFQIAKKRCLNPFHNYSINFIGRYGSGKTRLVKTMLNERYKHGESCIFVEYKEICDRINDIYYGDSKEKKSEIMHCLKNVKNLVIDDLGIGKNSAAKEAIFLEILNYRSAKSKEKGLNTDFTMNEEGENNLGGRIKSRINGIAYSVENNAGDYRPKVLTKRIELSSKHK